MSKITRTMYKDPPRGWRTVGWLPYTVLKSGKSVYRNIKSGEFSTEQDNNYLVKPTEAELVEIHAM